MDPYEFEVLISKLWEKKGFHTEVRSKSRDRGVDIEAEKTGYKEIIQAKCYSSNNKVGSQTVREYATLYQQIPTANSIVIVSAGEFTEEAKQLADDLNVSLYSGDSIVRELNKYGVDIGWRDSANGNSDDVQSAFSSQDRRSARNAVKKAIESLQDFHEVHNEFQEKEDDLSDGGVRMEVNMSINSVRAELKMHKREIEDNKTAIANLAGEYPVTDFLRLLTLAISALEEYKKFINYVRNSQPGGEFQSIAEQKETREQININEKLEEYTTITQRFDFNSFAEDMNV